MGISRGAGGNTVGVASFPPAVPPPTMGDVGDAAHASDEREEDEGMTENMGADGGVPG